jgi:S-layer domain
MTNSPDSPATTRLRAAWITLLLAIVAVFLASAAGTAAAQQTSTYAEGSPDLNVFLSDNEVTPGTESELIVQISNSGELLGTRSSAQDREIVTTARSVQVGFSAGDTPMTVKTGTQAIGDVKTSSPETVAFDVVVPESASPGSYGAEVDVEYNYISDAEDTSLTAPTVTTQSEDRTAGVTVDVSDDPRFDVIELDGDLRVGEEGRISGRLENVGGSIARNAEVEFTPSNENINALSSTSLSAISRPATPSCLASPSR